jgi:hypothetical protein
MVGYGKGTYSSVGNETAEAHTKTCSKNLHQIRVAERTDTRSSQRTREGQTLREERKKQKKKALKKEEDTHAHTSTSTKTKNTEARPPHRTVLVLFAPRDFCFVAPILEAIHFFHLYV